MERLEKKPVTATVKRSHFQGLSKEQCLLLQLQAYKGPSCTLWMRPIHIMSQDISFSSDREHRIITVF